MFTKIWIASIARMPKIPPAIVIQPMRWSRFRSSTSDMPSTGNGLNASMQRKPSCFTFLAASSSASGLPNSPMRPRTGSGTGGLLALARKHFLVLEDGDGRQEAHEQEEGRHEEAEHPDVGAPVPEARMIIAERGRQEVLVEAGDE